MTIPGIARLSSSPSVPSAPAWHSEPTLREVFALWFVTCLVFVAFVALLRNYFQLVNNSGDSSAYMAVASAIRHWNFQGLAVKHFWGLPYAIAAFSLLTG